MSSQKLLCHVLRSCLGNARLNMNEVLHASTAKRMNCILRSDSESLWSLRCAWGILSGVQSFRYKCKSIQCTSEVDSTQTDRCEVISIQNFKISGRLKLLYGISTFRIAKRCYMFFFCSALFAPPWGWSDFSSNRARFREEVHSEFSRREKKSETSRQKWFFSFCIDDSCTDFRVYGYEYCIHTRKMFMWVAILIKIPEESMPGNCPLKHCLHLIQNLTQIPQFLS